MNDNNFKNNQDSFDNEIKNALQSDIVPSENLILEVKTKMKNSAKKGISPVKVIGKTAAVAAILAAVLCTGVFAAVNISKEAAQTLYKIPVIGNIARVMTVKEYKSDSGNFSADIKQPEIDASNSEAAKKVNKLAKDYTDEIIKMYEDDKAASNGEGNYNVTTDYDVVIDNDNYFTLKISTVVAMGGSNSFEKYYTIDKKTDKLITLSDLFEKDFDYKTYIYNEIVKQMKENMKADDSITYFLPENFPSDPFAFTKITGDENFYVNDRGNIVICFNKYDVAPGYMGLVSFEIPPVK